MLKFKYEVTDDNEEGTVPAKLETKMFDDFQTALQYAKTGLLTFITRIPCKEGQLDKENQEIIWCWDDSWADDLEEPEVEDEDDDEYQQINDKLKTWGPLSYESKEDEKVTEGFEYEDYSDGEKPDELFSKTFEAALKECRKK